MDSISKLDLLLINAFEERICVLKSTQKTSDINKKKKEAWKDITDIVNANDGKSTRSADQIKARYKNIYNRTKAKMSKIKRHSQQTGGGEPSCPLSETEKKVLDLFGESPSFSGIPGARESAVEGEATTVVESLDDSQMERGNVSDSVNETYSQEEISIENRSIASTPHNSYLDHKTKSFQKIVKSPQHAPSRQSISQLQVEVLRAQLEAAKATSEAMQQLKAAAILHQEILNDQKSDKKNGNSYLPDQSFYHFTSL